MSQDLPVSPELAELVESYFNVNALDLADRLGVDLARGPDAEGLRRQFLDLVDNQRLSTKEWEALTSDKYSSKEELYAFLARIRADVVRAATTSGA